MNIIKSYIILSWRCCSNTFRLSFMDYLIRFQTNEITERTCSFSYGVDEISSKFTSICTCMNTLDVHVHVHVPYFLLYNWELHTSTFTTVKFIHDVTGDVERKKERKIERYKGRHLRQWKNENESCLRWDSNPQHSVLQTDALPTELHVPRQPSWQGQNQTSHTPV